MVASKHASGIWVRLLVGVAGPAAMFAALFAVWLASDRLVHIGPFDRGSFFWAVLLPLWCLSPSLAALLWRRLGPDVARPAATVVGLGLALVAGVILWYAGTSDQAGCELGPRTEAVGLIAPMGLLGLLIGAGWALCALASASLLTHRRVAVATVLGILLMLGHFIVAVIATGAVIMVAGGCNRPSV
ncbi:MAG TPA: hypothetical protein VFV53_04085 [Candidatus Limnocylindrales bacterium]|nr:hypothetical protein [Candidatus Limnocylindrales bacterium]